MNYPLIAMLVMFITQNISDIISTWIGIRVFGAVEQNPVGKWLFGSFGITTGGLMLKIPYFVAAFVGAYLYPLYAFYVLMAFNTLFTFVILNNIMVSAISAGYWEHPQKRRK